MAPIIASSKFHQCHYLPYSHLRYVQATKIMHHLCGHKSPPLSERQAVHRLCLPQHRILTSSLIHVGGEYMMLSRLGLGAFRFFLLQGLAVSAETIVSNLLSLSGSSLVSPRKAARPTPKLWARIVGYVWVLLWFWWSLPFKVDPGIQAGTYGGLTFERLSESAVNVYHRLTMNV